MSLLTAIVTMLLAADTSPQVLKKFKDIEIDERFYQLIVSNPMFMETTGAKIIRMPKGRNVVISIASTTVKGESAKDRQNAEKICRVKALANVVAERQGVQVAHTEELNEATVVTMDGEIEKATSVSKLLEITKTKVEGITKEMPVIGRWKSKDGDVQYLATGIFLDKDGKPEQDTTE